MTTATIATEIAPRAALPAGRVPAIPLVVFQTFETARVPARMAEAARSWTELNPAFAYRFFDADARRAFIATHFGARATDAYDRIEGGAFRADFWRYCVLCVHGGVYADLDSTCATDLLEVIEDADVFVSSRAGNLAWGIYNGFICSVPRHPFLEAAIARATDEILAHPPGEPFDGYTITGPGNLGMAVNRCLGRRRRAAHAPGRHQSGALRWRLFRKVPRSPGRSGHLVDGDRLILWTEYPEYRDDMTGAGHVHWTAGLRRDGLLTRARRRVRRIVRRLI